MLDIVPTEGRAPRPPGTAKPRRFSVPTNRRAALARPGEGARAYAIFRAYLVPRHFGTCSKVTYLGRNSAIFSGDCGALTRPGTDPTMKVAREFPASGHSIPQELWFR